MRSLRQFTVPQLVATAESGADNARKYIKGLIHSGYVVVARPKDNGRKGGHEVYNLVRNTGPKAPRMQSDGRTYDPNTHTVCDGGLVQNGGKSQ